LAAGVLVTGSAVGVLTAGIDGVGADSGIFGGLDVPNGVAGLIVVGVPILAGGTAPDAGCTGVVAGGAAWATATVAVRGAPLPLLSAAYAAPAAPATSSTSAAMMMAAERQLGTPERRLSGAPVPHCRHQSWPSVSVAAQLVQ
jgi:hypothetical protein